MYFNSLRCHPLGLLLALVLGLPPLVLGFLLLKFSPGPDGLGSQGGLGLVLWANYLFWGRPALLLGILLWRLQLRRNRADPASHDPARFCCAGGRGTAAPGRPASVVAADGYPRAQPRRAGPSARNF